MNQKPTGSTPVARAASYESVWPMRRGLFLGPVGTLGGDTLPCLGELCSGLDDQQYLP